MDLSHINKKCKVHLTLTKIQIKVHPCSLGTPPLIHHGPHLLLGLMLLDSILNLSINHFIHMILNLLSGATHHKRGGLNSTNFLVYFLHPNLNLNSLILIHLRNLRFLLNLM